MLNDELSIPADIKTSKEDGINASYAARILKVEIPDFFFYTFLSINNTKDSSTCKPDFNQFNLQKHSIILTSFGLKFLIQHTQI